MKYDDTLALDLYLANDNYEGHSFSDELDPEIVSLIKPRHVKAQTIQKKRTKAAAEVFTPAFIVREMTASFNLDRLSWKERIVQPCMEITCGEAPFIVNSYDAGTGEPIPFEERAGLLDIKFRAIKENASSEREIEISIIYALKSIYGYEYQGDSLYIARTNIYDSFVEFYTMMMGKEPDQILCQSVKGIIYQNFVQMDGLTFCKPGTDKEVYFFDWKEKKHVLAKDIFGGKGPEKKKTPTASKKKKSSTSKIPSTTPLF